MNPRCAPKAALARATPTRERGTTLLEAMIAILVLSFGVLGTARFQVGMLAQNTDAQSRLAATELSEELLANVRADVANAACYTWPQTGVCGNPAAAPIVTDWSTRVASSLPGFSSVTVTMAVPNRIAANMAWKSKTASEARSYTVTTDVRP